MKRLAIVLSLTVAFIGSNWASMNLGFEYGVDTSGCIAFNMLTELTAKEIPMCAASAENPLLAPREVWLWVVGDAIPPEYFAAAAPEKKP